MRTTRYDKLKDKHIGPVGSPKRDSFEKRSKKEIEDLKKAKKVSKRRKSKIILRAIEIVVVISIIVAYIYFSW